MILLAHNIRSLHNVGSFFRIADAFGIEKIYLSGYTGTPPHKDIAKVALGSEHRVAWEKHDDVIEVIHQCKSEGKTILALETGETSVSLKTISREVDPSQVVLLLGSEVEGIAPDLLSACDRVISIPMIGHKQSLNVSVACGIAVYALTFRS